MNIKKKQITKYIIEYLQQVVPNFQQKRKNFTCPKCGELTANIFPPSSNQCFCFSPTCQKIGNIIDICRKLEFGDNKDIPEEDIMNYLIDKLKIKINNDLEKLFDKYEKWGWDMVPTAKDIGEKSSYGKAAWVEQEWQLKSHKNREEWESWAEANHNFGVQTGKKSNIIGLDFDFVSSDLKKKIYGGKFKQEDLNKAKQEWDEGYKKLQEKLPFLFINTVEQRSFGGIHFFMSYDPDILKTAFDYEGIHVDIQSNAGQIIVEPSIIGGQNRQIIGEEIKEMPKEVKEFILQNCQKVTVPEKQEIKNLDNCELTFENLNNNRNNTFIKLFGEMRKDSTIKVAQRHLRMFNNLLDKKLPLKELLAMAREAEKYHNADVISISEKILEHFNVVKDIVHFRDLSDLLRMERKDIEEALRYLQDNEKIRKIKKDTYELIQDVEWKTDFMTLSKPLDIIVPYFHNYARFNRGSMIVLAAPTGYGKTTTTGNFIEHFVKQGLCPKLITTEADSGVGEIALARGLKEGDFKYYQTSDPLSVPFQNDEVRIIDWLSPKLGDYTQIGPMYQQLNDKLVDHGGLLIVWSQLRKDNGEFFAMNHIDQYASLAGKLLYPERNGIKDHLHPYIDVIKTRRPKKEKFFQIYLEYISETKELRLIK